MIVLAFLLALVCTPQPHCGRNAEIDAGSFRSLGLHLTGGGQQTVPEPGARYLRISVHLDSDKNNPFLLLVRDAEGRLLQTMTAADFAEADERWTARILGDSVSFELRGAPSVSLHLMKMIIMPANKAQTYYSVAHEPPQWTPLFTANEGLRPKRPWGESVGMLMASFDRTSWTCSGVLLSPTLFLTNYHCGAPEGVNSYWSPLVLSSALIDMSWDGDAMSREYQVDSALSSDPILDYALLRVHPTEGPGGNPGVAIREGETRPEVVLIHHPLALPKQIDVACTVDGTPIASWDGSLPNVRLRHTCDTEGSSSGAPLFNPDGELIALHHQGFDLDCNCHPIDQWNKAIRIEAIVDSIRKKKPAVAAELTIHH